MLTNRNEQGRTKIRFPLAMLDFVVPPHSLFFVSPPDRWKASLLQAALVCALLPGVNGCTTTTSPSEPSRATIRQARQAARSKMDAAREELEQIPPPSKNRYLSVHAKDAYGNPFLVVHPQTITLTIINRDQDPDAFSAGGVLRPAKARKQEVEVRLDDLPQGLAALGAEAWPYGRVVAVEESPAAPRSERIAVRRNVEATIQTLNDLGVVVDEWTGSNGALLR